MSQNSNILVELINSGSEIGIGDMAVSLDYLFCGIADKASDDHEVFSIGEEHRSERVAQVMDSYNWYAGCAAVALERTSKCIFRDRFFPAEEERVIGSIRFQLATELRSDRELLCFVFFCGSYFVGGIAVDRLNDFTRQGLIPHDIVIDNVYVFWGEREDFALTASGVKEHSEDTVIHRVIDNGYKLIKSVARPKSDSTRGWLAEVIFYFWEVIGDGVSIRHPRHKRGEDGADVDVILN